MIDDPTVKTALASALETAINTALGYDPGTRIALAKLTGIVAVECTKPEITLYWHSYDKGIKVLCHCEDTPSVRLRGSLPALINLMMQPNSNLANSGVEVLGNTALLAKLQSILKQLDIDWEIPLNNVLGDVVGHPIAELIRKKAAWSQYQAQQIPYWLGEYLTEELRSTPTQTELQQFYEDVDTVRMDTDRLLARMQQLNNTLAAKNLRPKTNTKESP